VFKLKKIHINSFIIKTNLYGSINSEFKILFETEMDYKNKLSILPDNNYLISGTVLNNNIPNFDFLLKGVSSISIDAHKMGYSAIPLGILIIRNKKWLDEISVKTPYISSNKQAGLLATRSGGPVAAAYAVSKYLGKEGYKKLIKECMSTTDYTEKKIRNLGLNLVVKPTMNVLGVKLKNPSAVVKKLTMFGWKVNKMERLSAIRIVLMPQITKEIIDDFIPDLEKVCREVGEL